MSVSIFKNQVVNKLLSDVSEVGPFNIEVCRTACLLNQPQVVIPGTAFLRVMSVLEVTSFKIPVCL